MLKFSPFVRIDSIDLLSETHAILDNVKFPLDKFGTRNLADELEYQKTTRKFGGCTRVRINWLYESYFLVLACNNGKVVAVPKYHWRPLRKLTNYEDTFDEMSKKVVAVVDGDEIQQTIPAEDYQGGKQVVIPESTLVRKQKVTEDQFDFKRLRDWQWDSEEQLANTRIGKVWAIQRSDADEMAAPIAQFVLPGSDTYHLLVKSEGQFLAIGVKYWDRLAVLETFNDGNVKFEYQKKMDTPHLFTPGDLVELTHRNNMVMEIVDPIPWKNLDSHDDHPDIIYTMMWEGTELEMEEMTKGLTINDLEDELCYCNNLSIKNVDATGKDSPVDKTRILMQVKKKFLRPVNVRHKVRLMHGYERDIMDCINHAKPDLAKWQKTPKRNAIFSKLKLSLDSSHEEKTAQKLAPTYVIKSSKGLPWDFTPNTGFGVRINEHEMILTHVDGDWALQNTRLQAYVNWKIVKVNNTEVHTKNDWEKAKASCQPGDIVEFTLKRVKQHGNVFTRFLERQANTNFEHKRDIMKPYHGWRIAELNGKPTSTRSDFYRQFNRLGHGEAVVFTMEVYQPQSIYLLRNNTSAETQWVDASEHGAVMRVLYLISRECTPDIDFGAREKTDELRYANMAQLASFFVPATDTRDPRFVASTWYGAAIAPMVLQVSMLLLLRNTVSGDITDERFSDRPAPFFMLTAMMVFVYLVLKWLTGPSVRMLYALMNIDFDKHYLPISSRLIAVGLYLADLAIGFSTGYYGTRFLLFSEDDRELLLNVVALGFVLEIDDMIAAIAPNLGYLRKIEVPKTVLLPEDTLKHFQGLTGTLGGRWTIPTL